MRYFSDLTCLPLGCILVVFILLSWMRIDASELPNAMNLKNGNNNNNCNESPSVIFGPNGDEEQLSCCTGWLLLDGKCVKVFQASKQECNSAACPWGRVCSPFGGHNCACPRGKRGTQCKDYCKKGYYGWGCRQTCSCQDGDCDPVTGACDNDGEIKDDDEESSTTMINRASNKTAGFCISGCGLRGALGCVCNGESNKCECPGYIVALLVVSVFTWVSVGSVIAGFYLKRNGFVQPLLERYRRKSERYDEGADDSGFNTDVDQTTTVLPWCDFPPPISQRSSGEYPLLAPLSVSQLFGLSSYVTRISRDSLPRSTSHSSEEEEEEDDESGDHDYLNIPEIKTEADSDGEEYSQPYEHLDHLSRQGSVHSQYAIRPDNCESSFMVRTWTETEDRRSDENSYVNESVLKWKRRFATRRTFLSRQQQRRLAGAGCPIAPLSSSCSDMRAIISPTKSAQENKRYNRKPTLKPKPELIKLKMLMDIEKRKRGLSRTRAVKSCDIIHPPEADITVSLSEINSIKDPGEEASDISQYERTRNKRIRHLRAALLKKGLSVPDSVSHQDRHMLLTRFEDEGMAEDECEGEHDPIYENELVLKPARHSRLNSMQTEGR